ncbi:3-hydroxyacyl-CoA dehydrogenase family protein [Photobacterium sp. DNB23_23_1]
MNYPEIRKICCYGVGLIGCGCAVNFAMNDVEVVMFNSKTTSLDRAKGRIEDSFDNLIASGAISRQEADAAMSLISYETNLPVALDGVQYIQESAPESYEVKKDIIETIDQYCDENVIIATSSSALLVSKLASFSKHPTRVICAHPYNPVHLIPLIEIVGNEGSEAVTEHVRAFFKRIKKEPVVLKKEIKGYIANRLQVVIGREIVEMLERGVCTVEDVDKAMTFGPGIRWAIMGHMLNMELGFTGGVKAMYDKIIVKGSDRSSYLDDMANWIKYPEDLADKAQAGVDEEMANRDPEIGNDKESLIQYRDKMLIELLKLHNKL